MSASDGVMENNTQTEQVSCRILLETFHLDKGELSSCSLK